MPSPTFRQSLSAPGLLQTLRRCFARITDPKPSAQIPLVDHLMSGLAMFGLKYPSLLQFDQDRDLIASNLQTLYGVSQIPSDPNGTKLSDFSLPILSL